MSEKVLCDECKKDLELEKTNSLIEEKIYNSEEFGEKDLVNVINYCKKEISGDSYDSCFDELSLLFMDFACLNFYNFDGILIGIKDCNCYVFHIEHSCYVSKCFLIDKKAIDYIRKNFEKVDLIDFVIKENKNLLLNIADYKNSCCISWARECLECAVCWSLIFYKKNNEKVMFANLFLKKVYPNRTMIKLVKNWEENTSMNCILQDIVQLMKDNKKYSIFCLRDLFSCADSKEKIERFVIEN